MRPIADISQRVQNQSMRSTIIAISLLGLGALGGCATTAAPRAAACERSLAKIAAAPAKHIGEAFCGEAILTLEHLLALAKPLERPAMTTDELAVIVFDSTKYAKHGMAQGKAYRVHIEGRVDGNPSCFVESDDVCAPYARQLFLYPKRLTVLGPA